MFNIDLGGGGGEAVLLNILNMGGGGVPEQRVSGGRLFIQNEARNLHTKVMSNGVEVIVRGTYHSYA